MTWPWQTAAQRRAAERQAFLDALKAVVSIVTAQSNAVERLSEVLLTELELYKVQGTPIARAHNDATETLLELERITQLREKGFPVESPLMEQYKFVLDTSDFS